MQGTTQFFAYGDLIEAQWRTAARLLTSPMLAAFALASVPVVVALVWTRVRDSETNDDLWLDLVTGILGILSFSYLFLPLLQEAGVRNGDARVPCAAARFRDLDRPSVSWPTGLSAWVTGPLVATEAMTRIWTANRSSDGASWRASSSRPSC